MALLTDSDYDYLQEIKQTFDEEETRRYLIFREFSLTRGIYVQSGQPAEVVDVILRIPENYNLSGPDMFWVNPPLRRADGVDIPQAHNGADPIQFEGREFERWSRHWNHIPWKGRQDGIDTIVDRVTWALANPNPQERNG